MKKTICTIFALIFMSSCSFKMLSIEGIEKPNVEKLNFSKSDISFGIKVNNPNTMGFKIVRSDLKVVVNNIEIGKIGLEKKSKVKANTTTTLPVQLKVDSGKLLSIGAMSLFSDPEILIKGYVKGRKFLFSKKYEVNFKDHFALQDFMGK